MNYSEEHNKQHQLYSITNGHKDKIANIPNSTLVYEKLLVGMSASENVIFSIFQRKCMS